MIYADDPTIKNILRRLDYLERKVKDLNVRTLPIQPLGPIPPTQEEINNEIAEIVKEITVLAAPNEKPTVIQDEPDHE